MHSFWMHQLEQRVSPRGEKVGLRSAGAIDRQVGARIRARRLELDIRQQQLATSIGVTFQQIQKYEKGVNRVSVGTLIAIAKALDVEITALLPRGSVSSAEDLVLDEPGLAELGVSYAKLNAAGRGLLLKHAKSLLDEKSLRK